ncbi:MAG: hypothetical protein IJV83_04215 [Clostridia bacterium]|nr:hypothetical protein [Clostridia bacterium]
MNFIKKKTAGICACLLGAGLFIGGASMLLNKECKTTEAQAIELNTTEISEKYFLNDSLQIPASITVEYQGKSYTLNDGVVYYPSGTAYKQNEYALNQLGEYEVLYTTTVDGKVLQATQKFSVIEKNWNITKAESSVEYGELTIAKSDYTHGLKVSLIDGDTFYYNVPVDLSKNAVTDIITIHSAQTTSTARVQNIIVRATDCYDADTYVDFYLYYAPGGSIYARAGASCNDDTGLIQSDTYENASNRKIVYIDGVRYAAWFSTWGASMGTGDKATSESGFTWRYNSDTKEVRVQQSRSPEGGNKVTELANVDIYGEDIFKGFTTGEVYLSIFAQNYTAATADFEIACIDGKTGEDLTITDYEDKKAPTLCVDYTPTIGNAVYVAQGEEVEIFDATAMDVSGANVESCVYYNYESTKRSSVYVENGKFTATKPGAYTIVYTATDLFGNKTVEKVIVNSVATENGKAIDFAVEQLSVIHAGEQTALPAYTVKGLNGDVTVEMRIIAPNGEVEEIQGNAFIPLHVGEYRIEYRYYDAIREYTTSYKVDSVASEVERFLTELKLPRYFIKGARYGLDDIKAFVFTSANPTPVDATFYVKYDGGEYVVADSQDFVITGTESVQVKYVYGEAVLESEIVKIVDVGYDNRISISKYFQGDFSAEEKGSYVRYTSNVAEGNSALSFINTLSFANFKLEFTIPLGAYYKSLRLTLTDYYDCSVKTMIELITVDGGLGVVIDGKIYKCNSTLADGQIKSIWYNNATKKFVLPDSTAASYTNKFTSDWCFLDVELVDIIQNSSIQIHALNNQSFGKLTGDRMKPEIFVENVSGQRSINDEVTLSPGIYTDVLSPALQSTLMVSVKAPDGEYVKTNDGQFLDGTTSGGKAYTFTVTQYGHYRVVYTATDQKGNLVELPFVIIVEDETAPTIELTCNKKVTVPYLTLYTIDDFVVSDNITAVEDLVVTLVVMDQRNNSVVSVGKEFEAKYAGEYTVYVYCVDEAGNSAYTTYTVVVGN